MSPMHANSPGPNALVVHALALGARMHRKDGTSCCRRRESEARELSLAHSGTRTALLLLLLMCRGRARRASAADSRRPRSFIARLWARHGDAQQHQQTSRRAAAAAVGGGRACMRLAGKSVVSRAVRAAAAAAAASGPALLRETGARGASRRPWPRCPRLTLSATHAQCTEHVHTSAYLCMRRSADTMGRVGLAAGDCALALAQPCAAALLNWT